MENKKLILLTPKQNFDMKLTVDERNIISELKFGTENEIARNPFSGEEVELTAEAIGLYDLIIGTEILNARDYKSILLYETCKDIFRKNWPKEYMKLLD